MEMDNLPYFTIFKGFSIFLGLFMSILSYFDPQIALKSQIPTESGVCYIHAIILYISKSNWRDGDHFIDSDGAFRVSRPKKHTHTNFDVKSIGLSSLIVLYMNFEWYQMDET